VIGLRGRLNLTKAFYLTAETDVGGFGIGSDMQWRLTPHSDATSPVTFIARLVTVIFMTISGMKPPTASFIRSHCMVPRSALGLSFRCRRNCPFCVERIRALANSTPVEHREQKVVSEIIGKLSHDWEE
jgi:predicted metal-binding membrane protein